MSNWSIHRAKTRSRTHLKRQLSGTADLESQNNGQLVFQNTLPECSRGEIATMACQVAPQQWRMKSFPCSLPHVPSLKTSKTRHCQRSSEPLSLCVVLRSLDAPTSCIHFWYHGRDCLLTPFPSHSSFPSPLGSSPLFSNSSLAWFSSVA